MYNREWERYEEMLAEKEKLWEEELKKLMERSTDVPEEDESQLTCNSANNTNTTTPTTTTSAQILATDWGQIWEINLFTTVRDKELAWNIGENISIFSLLL